jgi:hypothetical protein
MIAKQKATQKATQEAAVAEMPPTLDTPSTNNVGGAEPPPLNVTMARA